MRAAHSRARRAPLTRLEELDVQVGQFRLAQRARVPVVGRRGRGSSGAERPHAAARQRAGADRGGGGASRTSRGHARSQRGGRGGRQLEPGRQRRRQEQERRAAHVVWDACSWEDTRTIARRTFQLELTRAMDQAEGCAEDGKGNAEACGKAEAGIGGTACGRGGSSRGATPVAVLVAPRGVLVGGGGEQCGRGKCAAGSAGEEEPCNTARSTASTPPGVAPAAAVAPAAEAAAGGGEGGVAATRTHAPAQPAMAGVGMVLMTQNGGVKKIVSSVAPGSSAEQRGVQHGDNLLEVLCVRARAPTLPAPPRGFQMCRCARVRVCRRCARTLRVLISPAARFLRACPWQVDGVAVDGLTLNDVAKLVLGPLGSVIDVVLRRPEHGCAAESSKLIRLSLVRGWSVNKESTWGR
jgi:hypothetical protein